MILEWSNLFYLLAFGALFALQLGFFDFSGDETGQGDDAEPDFDSGEDSAPDFLASLYSDTVSGSAGDDVSIADAYNTDLAYFLSDGADTLVAGVGDDYASGGAGNDNLTLSDGNDIAAGGPGDDHITGGEGDDTLAGQAGNDVIEGNGGDDLLYGGSGSDTIEGGYGDDNIFGGSGDDTLSGDTLDAPEQIGRGVDVIDGGAGNDNIFLGDGDTGTGGDGADSFTVVEVANPDHGAANVTDFDPATDSLHIEYIPAEDPETGAPIEPQVDVSYDPESDLTSVRLDGAEVATLDGNAGITAGDITLTPIG